MTSATGPHSFLAFAGPSGFPKLGQFFSGLSLMARTARAVELSVEKSRLVPEAAVRRP